MKALKKICTALMLLAFAFVFASCSSGSDSDDDNGTNALVGNSYKYVKVDTKKTVTTTYAFKDDTVTKTKTTQPTGYLEETPDTEVMEYKYTYNADAGILSLQCVSWTTDDVKMTSMNDLYEYFAKAESCTVEEVKEEFGDDDWFAEKSSMCYFVKDNGNILLGNYFNEGKVDGDSEFEYWINGNRVKLEKELIDSKDDEWNIELDSSAKTFSDEDDEIEGSYAATKPTKTLKELNGDGNLNEANGYIMVKFAKLPSGLTSEPYNMETGTEYKFIFDLNCKEYIKQ